MNSNLALRIAVLAASSLLGSLAACDARQTATSSDRKVADSAAPAGADAPGSTSSDAIDAAITARIKAAYLSEPELKFQHISVATIGGIAIIDGAVNSQAASDMAERVASDVEGVRSIENRLMIGAFV